MSFFSKFQSLCSAQGETPNGVAKKLNISSGTITNWKQGQVPKTESIAQIAQYFGVSTDYLIGIESEPIDNELLLLGRKMQGISDEQRKRWYKTFLQAIDNIKGDEDNGKSKK